jgi:hypothetical protein
MQLSINESKRRSLTQFYWKLTKRVLAEMQQPVIEACTQVDPEDLKTRVRHLLDDDKMKALIRKIWIDTGSTFAVDTARKLDKIPKKADPDTQIDYWEDYFRKYSNERSQFVTGQIMDTQTQIINNIIDRNLEEARQGGLGIPETQRYLRNDMQDVLTEMNKYQAERIARTEVIGSSNKGSFDAASKSGLDMKKIWLTSGLDGIRESHLRYGAEDEATGGRAMDEEYASGLQYPSDPDADPEEIINCRCTVVYDVDEGLVQQPEVEPQPEPEPTPEPMPAPEIPVPEIPKIIDIEKISTYEELQKVALEQHGIDITPSKGRHTLDAQKMAVKRMGELKREYAGTSANLKELGIVPDNKSWYASAWSDRNIHLKPKYFNDIPALEKQIASDKITYFHPRGIPQEISAKSIIDHEFGHTLTSNDIMWKQNSWKELHDLKGAYTRTINELAKEEYALNNKLVNDFLKRDPPVLTGDIEKDFIANQERSKTLSKIQEMHYNWSRTRNAEQYKKALDELGIFNQDLNRVLNEFDKNYISGYAGKNLDEFAAECFTDAMNNKVNPSPFSIKGKAVIDKLYKR